MSLKVAPALLEKARDGKVSDEEFLDCIRTSLPYAWDMVARLVGELRDGDAEYAGNREVPGTDAQWGEMFRMMASNAMRDAVERHYGIRLAFQNCCHVAVFEPGAAEAFEHFTSAEAQLLNQRPELTHC
jgi:hypothetical protein